MYNMYNMYNMSTILCTILNIIFIAYCTIRTIYTVQYCALYFCCIVHIARIARIVLRVRILYILYTIVHYCTVLCTILHADIVYKIAHCPAPSGAVPACCPAPGWADSLACVVSPHPCCRPAPVQLQCKSPGRSLLFRNAPAAHSCCDLRRPAAAASGWRRRAVVVLQGVDETVNVLQDADDLDNLDDGLTAGAALAFLG